ncbi:MAG TPA: hypothetical protein VF704_11280 [Allosphingosinicella sp.]|jgi:hypothetical protein
MQRVRIGLTGLAFVFLAVLLAAVFTRDPAAEAPITPNLIEHEGSGDPATAPAGSSASTEPLAELGVAPGSSEMNEAQAAGAPASARPRGR